MEKFVPFFLLGCTACFVETSNAELSFVVDPGWSDNELLDRLLADEPEAPWPERPWLNATLSRTGTVDGAVTLGIKGGAFGVSAGLTQAITFEKGHATRAIFVATQTDTQQTLTNVDPETGTVRFSDLGIAAVCIYESHLSATTSAKAHLKFAGSGASTSVTAQDKIARSATSQLVEVGPDQSPRDFLDYCDSYYRDEVAPSIEEDLAALAVSVLTYENDSDECVRPVNRDENSDPSCPFTPTLFTAETVARCEPDRNFKHTCVLRSKRGNSCRLYESPDGNVSPSATSSSSLITNPTFSYPCDAERNLTCTLTEEPGWLNAGFAECL